LHAHDDLDQRGFARTVAANERNAPTGGQFERYVAKQRPPTMRFCQSSYRKHG